MSLGKLPRLNGKELVKVLTKSGFVLVRVEGSHHIMRRPDGPIVVIPVHSGEEIGPGLLIRILKKEINISREEFERLVEKYL